jgi:hypothetical protein
MKLTDYVQVLLALVSITAIVVVGRSNIKKQIISDLQELALAHEQTINRLKLENIQLRADSEAAAKKAAEDSAQKDERICALEETIDGYSELVRAGYLAGSSGTPSRNRSTSTKTP